MESLDESAVIAIKDVVEKSNEAAMVNLASQGGPRKLVMLTRLGREEFEMENYRKHQIETIDDLCDLAKRVAKSGSIWHDENKITVCFDDESRFDAASMALQKDSRFQAVMDLPSGGLTHAALVRLLRVKLDGAINKTVVDIFEAVKFDTAAESEIRQQRQSIGRRAMASAAGVGQIPNEIVVNTPVYSEAQVPDQMHMDIRCMVEIDSAEMKFYVTPIQRDIDSAKMEASRHIHDRLGEHTAGSENIVGIYQGRP